MRRYLAAFGPATRADLADWSGIRVSDLAAALDALEPLRRFRDEKGRELLDVQRAPLPPPSTPAPVRFLRSGTTCCSATRTGPSAARGVPQDGDREERGRRPDFLVDGFVAGTWRVEQGKVRLEPFAPLPRAARGGRRGGGTTRGVAPLMHLGAHVSSWAASTRRGRPDRGDRRQRRAGVHAEPAHVAADEPPPRELRGLQRAARRGRDPRPSCVTRSTSATSPPRGRRLREVGRVAEEHDRDGERDRGRRGRLPRRLAPRRRLDAGLERRWRGCAVLELCADDTWLLMENSAGAGGTIGRSVEELATLCERLDRHPRLGDLPRLVPPLVSGSTSPTPRRSTASSTSSTVDRARPPARTARQRLEGAARLEPRPPREHPRGAHGRAARRLSRPSGAAGPPRRAGGAGPTTTARTPARCGSSASCTRAASQTKKGAKRRKR